MYRILNILSQTHHHNLNFIGIFNDASINTWENTYAIFDNKMVTPPDYINKNSIKWFNLNSQLLPWIRDVHQSYDLIIMHGSFNPTIWSLLAERIDICEKTCWIVFGGDLIIEQYAKNLKMLEELETNRLVSVKNLRAIWLVSPDEKQLVLDKYKTAKNVDFCLISIQEPKYKVNKTTNNYDYLLGNSTDKSNRHEEILKLISIHQPDAKILCPLSYSNIKRQKKISRLGNELFGDKFTALTTIIKTEEYYSIIKNCHAFILPQKRQQAGQHWIFALKQGIPIYAEQSSPFAKLIKEKGGEVIPLEALNGSIQPVNTSEVNKAVYKKHFDRKNIVASWTKSIGKILITKKD